METSAVEQGLATGVSSAAPLLRVTRSTVVLDIRPGSPTRVLSTLGRPGTLPESRPPVRVRKGGALVVSEGEPEAEWINTAYRWWLAGKPGWVDPGWYAAPIRTEVRRVMTLEPGPALLQSLQALSWKGDGSCPADHAGEPGVAGRGVGRPGFPCACLVVTAAAWDVVASWTAHRAATALVSAAHEEPVEIESDRGLGRPTVFDPAVEDLAAALRISPISAQRRLDTARRIWGLPALAGLIDAGLVPQTTGRLLAAELANLRPAAAAAVLAVVLDRLRQRTAAGLRPWGWPDLRDLIAQLKAKRSPEDVLAARRRAKADRRVAVHPQGDGMATLAATIADVDAERIYRRLTAIAAGLDGDDDARSTDQERADVLVDLLTGSSSSDPSAASPAPPAPPADPGATAAPQDPADEWAPHAGPPEDPAPAGPGGNDAAGPASGGGTGTGTGTGTGPGSTPTVLGCGCGGDAAVNVVITLQALLGLTEDPARIDGVGAVPAEVARELAADGRWRDGGTSRERQRVGEDSGRSASHGHGDRDSAVPTRRRAGRLVRAREPRCRMPGCRRSAIRSDLDHTMEYPDGPTAWWNLGPLCRRHHVEKTHHDYDLHGPPDEAAADVDGIGWIWTTPSGIWITDHPEPPLE